MDTVLSVFDTDKNLIEVDDRNILPGWKPISPHVVLLLERMGFIRL